MTSPEVLFGVAAAAAVLSLWAAVFATRADRASRRALEVADLRWESMTKPVPHITFPGPPAPGQPIDLAVENLGGTLAAGGVIVQSGDDLYAGELTLPELLRLLTAFDSSPANVARQRHFLISQLGIPAEFLRLRRLERDE